MDNLKKWSANLLTTQLHYTTYGDLPNEWAFSLNLLKDEEVVMRKNLKVSTKRFAGNGLQRKRKAMTHWFEMLHGVTQALDRKEWGVCRDDLIREKDKTGHTSRKQRLNQVKSNQDQWKVMIQMINNQINGEIVNKNVRSVKDNEKWNMNYFQSKLSY